MTIEVEIGEIKELLGELNRKLDAVLEEQEVRGIEAISERSLRDFLANLYSKSDLNVVYK